ncbi:hypothetical protein F4781DRAFT_195273 [Annulohypoxylon bovei var. microspora]|nr:hypothetical protein F4781DRAFT_195273 [Annulohypoxylon bovei var. microspora]
MASAMYATQPGAQYGYPQPPPSPPMDETSKCSLPSISNLLVMADAGSPTTEQSPQSQQAPSVKVETRPNSSHCGSNGPSRAALPPTPPMSSDASFEGYNSPSTRSVSVVSAHNYYYETTPPLEDVHRHQMTAAAAPRMSIQASAYSQPAFAAPYLGQAPIPPYYPAGLPGAHAAQPQISGLYYQRPLPQAFPPLPVTVSLATGQGANPWQHHHYISPSSAASFPQSQDRYICQTCNKAFSRPSSLRIHSHSHTGEKPFKCPHAGCGKAFSVRSNMKRHERGCHDNGNASHHR